MLIADEPLFISAIATVGFVLGFVAAAVALRAWPAAEIDADALGIGAPTEPPGAAS